MSRRDSGFNICLLVTRRNEQCFVLTAGPVVSPLQHSPEKLGEIFCVGLTGLRPTANGLVVEKESQHAAYALHVG